MSFDKRILDRNNSSGCRSGFAKRLVILILALLSLLLLVGVWLADRPVSTEDAHEEAMHFLNQLRAGEIDLAWEDTTAEFKSFVGRDRLRKTVRSNPVFQHPFEMTSSQSVEIGPLRLFECLFRSAKFADTNVRILLAPTKQGQWKVERLEIQSASM